MGTSRKLQSKDSSRWWLSKYFIAFIAFVIWVAIFDKHNIWTQWKLQQTVSKLENERSDYVSKIEEYKIKKEDFESNKERFARENFYFHKENEDVFIIEKTKESQD